MTKNSKQTGFTVIELILAMGFITALMLGIALAVIQVATTYNKGVTLTEVNQAGRTLSTEVSGAISQSGKFDVTQHFRSTSTGGRICTGQYTYMWNYARALEDNELAQLTHFDGSTEPIYFAKVKDPDQLYCQMSSDTQYAALIIATEDAVDSSELLKPGERDLKVYQFNVALAENGQDALSGQEMYAASFTIGAGRMSAVDDTDPENVTCRPPADPASDPAYCAIQKFDLVIRAGNGVN
jgi:type II secretory pathway pseudopilin PulG